MVLTATLTTTTAALKGVASGVTQRLTLSASGPRILAVRGTRLTVSAARAPVTQICVATFAALLSV